jgi:hypothetical protein
LHRWRGRYGRLIVAAFGRGSSIAAALFAWP